MTNSAEARRQLDQATMFGMATAATLDGASVATTRYQHGVMVSADLNNTFDIKHSPASKAAPKHGLHYTPKAPTF